MWDKYFVSPDAEKISSLIRGEYIFLAKWHHIWSVSQKGRILISCRCAYYYYVLSLKREKMFYGPMGSYISMHLSMGRICVLMEIIYFRTKCPNEPATVAFLACDGFSHRVFPHEGFNAPV
jgi:hypothetical protein